MKTVELSAETNTKLELNQINGKTMPPYGKYCVLGRVQIDCEDEIASSETGPTFRSTLFRSFSFKFEPRKSIQQEASPKMERKFKFQSPMVNKLVMVIITSTSFLAKFKASIWPQHDR